MANNFDDEELIATTSKPEDKRLILGRQAANLAEEIMQLLLTPELIKNPNAFIIFNAAINEVKRRCDQVLSHPELEHLKHHQLGYVSKDDVDDFLAMDTDKVGKC